MIALDYIIVGTIIIFAAWGFRKGFLQSLGGIIGVVIASVVAGKFFFWLGQYVGTSNLANVVAFLAIFSITLKIVGFMFWILGKIFKVISILPFVQTFDRALGTALGLVQGLLVVSVVLFFANKYPINDWFISQLQESFLADIFITISIIFIPLFPEAVKKLQSII